MIAKKSRELLAKMIGMLGKDNENECLVALRFIKQKMESEGLTFGDLANIISGDSQSTQHTITVERRGKKNEAAEIAKAILKKTKHRLGYAERRFLNDLIQSSDMTGGYFELSTKQANWLSVLRDQYLKAHHKTYRTKAPRKDKTYQHVAHDLGLDDSPDMADGDPPF